MQLFDSLVNFVAGLGTGRDKRTGTGYAATADTAQELTTFYRESWLAKKIVNLPPYDAFREWRNWQGDAQQIEKIEKEEKRLDLLRTYMRAATLARLYGYCAIYISNGDGDVTTELKPETVGANGIRFLNILLPRQLKDGPLDYNPESSGFMKPLYYELTVGAGAVTALQGVHIHPSRLIMFEGDSVPDPEIDIRDTGGKIGGDSVLKSRKQAIVDAEATAANIASLVFEAKIDIIKIPNFFANLIDPQYREQLFTRFELAATAKGINGALLLDAEEQYEQKSAQFGNLAELINTFVQQVSGASDIPITRLLGQSPGGMNSTGEHDLRNYYDHISAQQKVSIAPVIAPLDEMIIRSALGDRPADVFYNWASLWQLSAKEVAEIGKINSETIAKLVDTNLYPQEALAKVGANLMVETGVLPGFMQYLEEAGGIDANLDLQAELEEMERERVAREATNAITAANSNSSRSVAVGDAAPGPKPLYVRRDVLNASEIIAHYEAQGLSNLLAPEKMHVTVIYSETPVDWFKTGEAWQAELKIVPGGARDNAKFGPPGQEDALVLMISSNELDWRYQAFLAAGAKSSYPEYNPHITIKYNDLTPIEEYAEIEPYRGAIVLGPEIYKVPVKNWSA